MMMNKGDKQFFVGLMSQQEKRLVDLIERQDQKFTKRFEDQDQKFTGLFNKLDQKFTGLFNKLDQKFTGLFGELESKVQYNGLMLESLQDTVGAIGDNVIDLNRRMKNVETDVADIKETIRDYPVMRKMVQKHERLLAAK